MKTLINNGIAVLNQEKIIGKNKTVIVLGLPRSGTSMIGKVLYMLDIFHDDGDLNLNVYEDQKAIQMFEQDIENLPSYIREQDSKYTVWGFKRPGAYNYISKYMHLLHNPVFLIPFKDILSISLRKNISINKEFNESLNETMKQTQELMKFIESSDIPMILFSYEKAILNSEYFVKELVEVLSLDVSEEMIHNAVNAITINPQAYLDSSRIRVVGKVENLQNSILSGWAKYDQNDEAVEIKVYDKSNFLLGTTKASIYRKDLLDNNIGNGHHGFKINIDNNLGIEDLVVTAGKHNDVLKKVENIK